MKATRFSATYTRDDSRSSKIVCIYAGCLVQAKFQLNIGPVKSKLYEYCVKQNSYVCSTQHQRPYANCCNENLCVYLWMVYVTFCKSSERCVYVFVFLGFHYTLDECMPYNLNNRLPITRICVWYFTVYVSRSLFLDMEKEDHKGLRVALVTKAFLRTAQSIFTSYPHTKPVILPLNIN